MIRKVVLKNFKRFEDVTFEVPGHLVLAGPNNTGKTTLLQAVAAWSFGLNKWNQLADYNPRKNGYQWQDLERLAFSAVPLRTFDLLWRDRATKGNIQIGIELDRLPLTFLEFNFQAAGQMRVRPVDKTDGMLLSLGEFNLSATFIPAMAGLAREELELKKPETVAALLAQGRAGDVLRNLVVLAHADEQAWRELNDTLYRMFGSSLLAPKGDDQIRCEYRNCLPAEVEKSRLPAFDIASAGSGFLQVLLVLSLMLTQSRRKGSHVLLMDEPDAHLHLILQKTIYAELRRIAADRDAQLVVATHSEEVVRSVPLNELCLMYGTPMLVDNAATTEKAAQALGILDHGDLLHANGAKGVLYAEDYTDFDLLETYARAAGDDVAHKLLSVQLMRKRSQGEAPEGLGALSPTRHWEMLKLVNPNLPGVDLIDGDSKNTGAESITGGSEKMQRLRWNYYEIESYLLIPAVWKRFLDKQLGPGNAANTAFAAAMQELAKKLDKAYGDAPLTPTPLQERFLETERASKTLIPAMLQAAGLNNFPKNRYSEIAAMMQPEDVHPEIKDKLAKLKQAFGIVSFHPPADGSDMV